MKKAGDRFVLNPSRLRRRILEMAYAGQSVHIACAFSLVEIVSVLYSGVAQIENPGDTDRDFVILSKGHGVMAMYAAFCELGWMSVHDLESYFKDGSSLRGLCEGDVSGLEVTSGSLGHGLPIAVGIAFGLLRRGSTRRVFCIVGDGEMNEGSMWEALLFANHHNLWNLSVIVDSNLFQAMGRIDDVVRLEPLAAKFAAFGFCTRECDGHDGNKLRELLVDRPENGKSPQALIARTVKGKGVSFMEAKNEWHYSRLDAATLAAALGELPA